MEMAQERELLHQRQAWWPLDTMACSLETSSCSLFGWDPHLFYFGQGAIGNGASSDSGSHEHHELDILVPKCMEFPVSEASAAVTGLLTVQDAMAMPAELDELLQNLLDSDEEGFSSWCALKEASATAMSLFQHDDYFNLGTVSPTVPTSPEKTLTPPQAELAGSSSSQGSGGPRASDTTNGAQCQTVGANRSSKRWAPAEKESRGGESCKRSRTASSIVGIGSSVARPFAVVKPSGADGEVTLADINKWILAPPARPVRHPVGEFACAPRVSSGNRPAPSGKTVAGFTRVHTAGRGTVTVVRTIG